MANFKLSTTFAALLSAGLLAGCLGGGGGGSSDSSTSGSSSSSSGSSSTTTPATTTTLTGTAATGAAVVGGTVSVTCAGGSTATTTKTGSAGEWTLTVTGQTLPCAVKVTGGTVNGLASTQELYSVATSAGTTNVTPLTSLIVANATGKDPASWYSGLTTSELQKVTTAALTAASKSVSDSLGITSTLNGENPLTTSFAPTKGNRQDDVLEAMTKALSKSGLTFKDLITTAGYAFPKNVTIDFGSAYSTYTATSSSGTTSGTTTGTTTGTGTATGSYKLTLTVNILNPVATTTNVIINNVPKPSTQDEFCGWVNDPTKNTSLANNLGSNSGGTLKINSCSFSGSTGQIGATVTISSPISMSINYNVTYLYQ